MPWIEPGGGPLFAPGSSPTCPGTIWTTTGTWTITLPPSPGSFWRSSRTAAHPRGLAVLNLDDPRGQELRDAGRVPASPTASTATARCGPLSSPHPPGRTLSPAHHAGGGRGDRPPAWWGPLTWPISWRLRHRPGAGDHPDTVARGIAAGPGAGPAGAVRSPQGPGVLVDYAHTPAAITQALAALQTLGLFPADHRVRLRRRPGPGQAAPDGPGRGRGLASGRGHHRQPPHRGSPGHHAGDRAGSPGHGRPASRGRGQARCGATWWSRPPGGHPMAVALAQPREAVLVAGKGHENYQIWGAERRHFDDREEVVQALAEYHG